jgi:GrpB-like predicted nucleotidyltransferase (UPF0157 family)
MAVRSEPDSLRAYDPRWPALFEAEAALLRGERHLADATVEHIGSTAVPGMPARPVIDLMLVLDRELTSLQARALKRLGYTRLRARSSGRLHLRKGTPRTHCVHVVRAGSREQWDALKFRELLRADDLAAARYAALKWTRATRAANDPGAYSRAKAAFIRSTLQDASAHRLRRAAPLDDPLEVPTPGVEPASTEVYTRNDRV